MIYSIESAGIGTLFGVVTDPFKTNLVNPVHLLATVFSIMYERSEHLEFNLLDKVLALTVGVLMLLQYSKRLVDL